MAFTVNATAVDSEPALLAHWKFDEGEGTIAMDSSEHGTEAHLHGGEWTDGVVGKGVLLKGESWVEIKAKGLFDISEEYTLEIWVKTLEAGAFTLLAKGGWSRGWQSTIHENFIGIGSRGIEGVGKVYYSKFPFGENQPFRQIVFTSTRPEGSETSTLTFYVDGKLRATEQLQGELLINDSPLTIGQNIATESGYMQGVIDEVRIFNRALSASEILDRYEAIEQQNY